MPKHIIVLGAFPDSVANFRGDLIRSFREQGHRVTVMTAPCSASVREEIEGLGAEFEPYHIQRSARNPLSDIKTWWELRNAFRRLKPDIVLAYTIKPIIWGGIGSLPGSHLYALITGLGFAFQGSSRSRRLLSGLVTRLYTHALRRSKAVIFQNQDNQAFFVDKRIVSEDKSFVVAGSGVNPDFYQCEPLPTGPTTFLLVARLLREKGIREYVEAARIVRSKFPHVRFQLVGPKDPSPDGIPEHEVQQWKHEAIIEYHGAVRDIRPFLKGCHVYVLPSYHEGMPRTVLEAMSSGRPILTTEVAGCRETVVPGKNGWLVPAADVPALVERLEWFIENADSWSEMGDHSRKLVEQRFDVRLVNEKMLSIMRLTEQDAIGP